LATRAGEHADSNGRAFRPGPHAAATGVQRTVALSAWLLRGAAEVVFQRLACLAQLRSASRLAASSVRRRSVLASSAALSA